jgi:hypothetical protein
LIPVYDVLSAQPNVDMRQIRAKDFKLAMAVGQQPALCSERNHAAAISSNGRHGQLT